jgi:hypothetical protein
MEVTKEDFDNDKEYKEIFENKKIKELIRKEKIKQKKKTLIKNSLKDLVKKVLHIINVQKQGNMEANSSGSPSYPNSSIH